MRGLRRFGLRNIFLVTFILLLLAGSSYALCGHPTPRLVCAEYFHEQVVVTATLVRIRHFVPKDPDGDEYDLFAMETTRVLRGKIPQHFRVIQEYNSGRAGIDWTLGESYLLFLFYSAEDKAWSLDGCSNSDLLSKSGTVLQEIQRLQTHKGNGGTIQGLVWPGPNTTVLVRGMHLNFKTTTQANQRGEFSVHVPAGFYTVWPVHQGKRFEVDFLSYQDPRKIEIVDGGCAQMQFNVREDRK